MQKYDFNALFNVHDPFPCTSGLGVGEGIKVRRIKRCKNITPNVFCFI